MCPSGTLSGILLGLWNSAVRKQMGSLFHWKLLIFLIVVMTALIVWRPFCKYLCPLGAFYGFFNRIALWRMHLDKSACISCGACSKACRMNIDPSKKPNSMECVRCGDCVRACPVKALHQGFTSPVQKKES